MTKSAMTDIKPSAARPGGKVMDVRQTRCGLRAEYDGPARLWRYYRWDHVAGRYVEIGSARRYED